MSNGGIYMSVDIEERKKTSYVFKFKCNVPDCNRHRDIDVNDEDIDEAVRILTDMLYWGVVECDDMVFYCPEHRDFMNFLHNHARDIVVAYVETHDVVDWVETAVSRGNLQDDSFFELIKGHIYGDSTVFDIAIRNGDGEEFEEFVNDKFFENIRKEYGISLENPSQDLYCTSQESIESMHDSSTVYPTTHHVYIKSGNLYRGLCGEHETKELNSPNLKKGWDDYSQLSHGYSCGECGRIAKRLLGYER